MKEVRIDLSQAEDGFDVYEAIVQGIQAPDWHGRNINAIMESLTFGGNGTLAPPFSILLAMPEGVPAQVREVALYFASLVESECDPREVSVRWI